jgi:hypothetical protein
MISYDFKPAFSANVLGIHSNALAYLVNAYYSNPLRANPSSSSLEDNIISQAPAPSTYYLCFNIFL